MSTPTDQPHDPSGPLAYAPKWAREARPTRPTDGAPGLVPDDKPGEGKSSRLPAVDAYPFPFEGDAPPHRLRARRLDPDDCPPPPMQLQTRSTVAVVGRLVLVVIVAAAIALFAVEELPIPSAWKSSGEKRVELASAVSRPASAPVSAPVSPPVSAPVPAPQRVAAALPAPQRVAPRLVAAGGRAIAGEPALIGVTLEGDVHGTVMIHGLPSGMSVSMGEAFGASSWRVAATDIANTWVLAPQDFTGTIDLGIELRLADDAIADRRTVRLEWAPPPTPASPVPTAPSLDRDEIATLIKRSEDFIAAGDLAAARVLLHRAAEARDAGAALALAATYDPIVLEKLKVYGFAADVDTARAWYEKAKEFGSAEAPRRLELLASQTR
jgi:hypothetical protein